MAELLFNQPLEIAFAGGFHEIQATICGPFAIHPIGVEQVFANEEDAASGLPVEVIGVDVPTFALTHVHSGWSIGSPVTDETGLLDVLIQLGKDAEISDWFDNRDDPLVIQRDIPPEMKERMKGIIRRALRLDGDR